MRAARLTEAAPVSNKPLHILDVPRAEPGPGEILIRVAACAVCRTDLQLAEGDLEARRLPITPGHQAVGAVAASAWSAERTAATAPGWPGWAAVLRILLGAGRSSRLRGFWLGPGRVRGTSWRTQDSRSGYRRSPTRCCAVALRVVVPLLKVSGGTISTASSASAPQRRLVSGGGALGLQLFVATRSVQEQRRARTRRGFGRADRRRRRCRCGHHLRARRRVGCARWVARTRRHGSKCDPSTACSFLFKTGGSGRSGVAGFTRRDAQRFLEHGGIQRDRRRPVSAGVGE
jgi:hypothetical protein